MEHCAAYGKTSLGYLTFLMILTLSCRNFKCVSLSLRPSQYKGRYRPSHLTNLGMMDQLSVEASTRSSSISKLNYQPSKLIQGYTKDSIKEKLTEVLISSYPMLSTLIEQKPQYDPVITLTKQDFGDYSCNIAMLLSKELKSKPVDIAQNIQKELLVYKYMFGIEISGPGFLNFQLSSDYLKRRILDMLGNERLGLPELQSDQRKRIVVDFSSPNIAKEMHVGHLRSTIIGDTISRVLEFIGHDVLRLNHVGDWGTQFGMLIHYMKTEYPDAIREYLNDDTTDVSKSITAIKDLVVFYQAAKKRFDENLNNFQDNSRAEVVKLQSGDVDNVRIWKAICDQSRKEFQIIYDLLNITVNERGESFYNPYLDSTVTYLKDMGVAVESQGATCIFVPGYGNSDGTPMPLIVKKSDGGYLYATTDLAALRHRIEVEKADRIIYVTDEGQAQHFAMVFAAAKLAKIIPSHVSLVHVPFGVVQGEDGKKLKSRSGDTIRLKDLLEEAMNLAIEDMVTRKKSDRMSSHTSATHNSSSDLGPVDNVDADDTASLSALELSTAKTIGIAAVKYADLSMNRESNYRFSYKKMLSLSGNTAPYMMYAYVRIKGIQRKALASLVGDSTGSLVSDVKLEDLSFTMPEEIAIAKHLIRCDEILLDVAENLYPNKLSQKFNQFYEKCPVIKAETKQEQVSRAVLCSITAVMDRIHIRISSYSIRALS